MQWSKTGWKCSLLLELCCCATFAGRPTLSRPLSRPLIWPLTTYCTGTDWVIIVCDHICSCSRQPPLSAKTTDDLGYCCSVIGLSNAPLWFRRVISYHSHWQPKATRGYRLLIEPYYGQLEKKSFWRGCFARCTSRFYVCVRVWEWVWDNTYISAQRGEMRVAAWTASWCENSHCFAPCSDWWRQQSRCPLPTGSCSLKSVCWALWSLDGETNLEECAGKRNA